MPLGKLSAVPRSPSSSSSPNSLSYSPLVMTTKELLKQRSERELWFSFLLFQFSFFIFFLPFFIFQLFHRQFRGTSSLPRGDCLLDDDRHLRFFNGCNKKHKPHSSFLC